MQIETAEDRKAFFLTVDFADDCLLQGPDLFNQTIPVIFNATTDPVDLYETSVEAPSANFICRREDVAGVERRRLKQYSATIRGVSYQLERLADDQDGNITTVFLKK